MKGVWILGLTFLVLMPFVSGVEEVNFYGVLDNYEIRWSNGNNTLFLYIDDAESDNPDGKITNLVIDFAFLDLTDIRTRSAYFSFVYDGEVFEYNGQYVGGDVSYFHSQEGSVIKGSLNIDFRDGTGTNYEEYEEGSLIFSEDTQAVYVFTGILTESEKKISDLEGWRDSIDSWRSDVESWMQNVNGWMASVDGSLIDLAADVADLFDVTDDHEGRIGALEGSQGTYNISFGDYWSYLDFRDREQIACGFGIDNELELFKMLDLGASCMADYSRSRPRCDCEEVSGECNLDNPLYCYAWELRRDDLRLELLNTAEEDVEVVSVSVEGCELYDRETGIRAGDDRRIRIECFEEFTGGDVFIEYMGEDEILRTVEGSVSV